MEFILNIDDKIINFVDKNMNNKAVERFMKFVSKIGDNGAVWIGMAFALILMGGKKRRAGLIMLASLTVEASICNLVIKPSVGRIRPFDVYGFKISIKRPMDYSFPSGHTAAAFAAAYSMYLSDRKHGLPMLYAAAVMGFSRIYLLVHYPFDVIAGAFLGIVSAASVHLFADRRKKH